jgi:hypothetical protein
MAALWYWSIEAGIATEEANGFQAKSTRFHGHHWPILWPDDVVTAKGVPHDQVSVFEGAILLHIGWQTISTWVLVWVVASGIPLSWIIVRDPEVMADEATALPLKGSFLEEGKDIPLWHEFVGDGLTEGIARVWIDDFPVSGCARLNRALRLGFGSQKCLADDPGVSAWIRWSPGEGLAVDLDH